MGAKVLLVDDDVEFVELLRDYLAREGFEVTAAHDGEAGLAEALTGRHAIVVLDIMMPGRNGIEVLGLIRAAGLLPVLMLTARGDDIDRIMGLELGADDYVPKPCSPRELTARIRVILKRVDRQATSTQPLIAGALTLWPEQLRAEWGGRLVSLTGTEFSLLEVLVRHAGRIVDKSELSRQALGRPLARFDRGIDVHVSSLRQKLGVLPDGRSCIQTVVRKGYQLIIG
ncbi:MAG: response regulator transcription factor [Pseudomonadota bacterium]